LAIEIIQGVAACCLGVLLGFYLVYGIVCYAYARRWKPAAGTPSEADLPTLTMIIPTYNEASVMKTRFRNLNTLRYPRDKVQFIFVDGGSSDGTPELIEEFKGNLDVRVRRNKQREGYNKALIDGFQEASGELVAFTGAETHFQEDALLQMIKHFGKSEVGAVTGRMQIKSAVGVSSAIEAGYRQLYDFVRLGETAIDSPFDIKGEICVGRREVVRGLVNTPALTRRGCIDSSLVFQSKLMGMRTVFEPSAVYAEDAPYSFRESFAQEARRGTTLIENMLIFRRIMMNGHYGKFGTLIMPAHFVMLVVTPFLLVLATSTLALASILNPMSWTSLVLVLGALAITGFRTVQGFVKTQLALIVANLGIVFGADTQLFRRLPSTRLSR
jgi:cellulose synthase/poly-beta-1,6-N-acetylglucosamine synthase-like glycosyltransferase